MADFLPDPPPPEGNRWPSGILDYQQYRVVQESHLERLDREGLVTNHRLSFRETRHADRLVDVNFAGWVATASGGRLYLNEILSAVEQRRGPAVLAREYSYQGRLVRSPRSGQQLFRYDNCHGGLETLHRHGFDVDGFEAEIRPISLFEMPTLADAVREAEYYSAYLRERIPDDFRP